MSDEWALKWKHTIDTVKDPHIVVVQWLDQAPIPPIRRRLSDLPGSRRPVVAIVDAGVADNPWFHDILGDPNDPFLIDATQWGWNGPSEAGFNSSLHGTFLAGLIRQGAPDAQILSVTMNRDSTGRIASGEILRALQWLHTLMSAPNRERFIDVICLAIGFRIDDPSDDPSDHEYATQVGQAIHRVGECGSWLVVSAGNHVEGKDDHVYPAALLKDDHHLPMAAVGALNNNGTQADYSIQGSWITHRYAGEGVSIVPLSSAQPNGDNRQLLNVHTDIDGYAEGRGTSVAAARFAAGLATEMLKMDGGVGDVRPEAAKARMNKALEIVGGMYGTPFE